MDLIEAATELSRVSTAPDGTYEGAMEATQDVLESADRHPDRLDDGLRVLLAAVRAEDDGRAGIGAIVCGAMIERGADPTLATEHIVERFIEVAKTSGRYVARCTEYFEEEILSDDAVCEVCGPGDEAENVMIPEVRSAVSQQFPQGEDAWLALDLFCRPAVSVLARDPETRKKIAQNVELVNLIGALSQHQPGAFFVWALLRLLDDEELIVIDPGVEGAQAAGWKVRIDGVADNFQLHLLLAHELQQSGYLDDEPLPDEVVAVITGEGPPVLDEHVMGYWNLYNWTALGPGRTLPDGYFNQGSQHLIWNEGVPADIMLLNDHRVVLLGPAPVIRQWRPARLFEPLPGRLEIVEALDEATLSDWLAKIDAELDAARKP